MGTGAAGRNWCCFWPRAPASSRLSTSVSNSHKKSLDSLKWRTCIGCHACLFEIPIKPKVSPATRTARPQQQPPPEASLTALPGQRHLFSVRTSGGIRFSF